MEFLQHFSIQKHIFLFVISSAGSFFNDALTEPQESHSDSGRVIVIPDKLILEEHYKRIMAAGHSYSGTGAACVRKNSTSALKRKSTSLCSWVSGTDLTVCLLLLSTQQHLSAIYGQPWFPLRNVRFPTQQALIWDFYTWHCWHCWQVTWRLTLAQNPGTPQVMPT